MEIQRVEPFLDYLSKIHHRTARVIRCIPPEKLEWTYREGKFTLGDQIRHLVTIERYMSVRWQRAPLTTMLSWFILC